MKTKGRRQSKNVEVQTPKQKKVAEAGLELQDRARGNETLKEKTSIRDQNWSPEMQTLREISNPGAVNSRMANSKEMAGRAIKSPGERRSLKDPKPKTLKEQKDFPFFKHYQKGK